MRHAVRYVQFEDPVSSEIWPCDWMCSLSRSCSLLERGDSICPECLPLFLLPYNATLTTLLLASLASFHYQTIELEELADNCLPLRGVSCLVCIHAPSSVSS